jgi:hypothetical protein
MKLNDFLTAQGRSRPAPTRPVNFKVLGVNGQMAGLVADAGAELAFVPEAARQEALRDANRAVAEAYVDQPVPEERRDDEGKYHVLFRALRDKDDVRQPFADSVKELKNALVLPEAARLWREYHQFVDEEFPDAVDADTFEKLVEEARRSFLSDLLSRFGFDAVRRSMPGLLARLKTSPTRT